jgi:hypothetical protein
MSNLKFPITCGIGHDSKQIKDLTDLISHHSSAHSSLELNEYQNLLDTNPDGATTTGAPRKPPTTQVAPPIKISGNETAKWGMTKQQFRDVDADSLASGARYSVHEWNSFLQLLGKKANIIVNGAKVALDLLVFILEHRATEDVDDLGSISLQSYDGTTESVMTWSAFKAAGKENWSNTGKLFTFRRFIPTFNKLWSEQWTDPEVGALDEVRMNGTKHSRKYTINSQPVPAWLVVEGLMFKDSLTPEEAAVRNSAIDNAKRDKDRSGTSGSRIGYVGDNSAKVHAGLDASTKRLWGNPIAFTRGGIGSDNAPPTDPWTDRLKEHVAQTEAARNAGL